MNDLTVVIGETHELIRTALTAMLRQQGVGNVRATRDIKRLTDEVNTHAADLILVSSELDDAVFKAIKLIRRHAFGINPFAVVTVMADSGNGTHVKQTASSGADDMLPRPVSPGKIMERARYIAYNRLPFVALADYIGPGRRPNDKDRRHKSFEVFNSLRQKLAGKKLTQADLLSSVERGMRQVRSSQLDNFGLRLGLICEKILRAYESQNINEDVLKNLSILNRSLKQASETARDLGEQKLSAVCISFEKQIASLASQYAKPSANQLDLIRKLHIAFDQVRT